MTTMPQDILKEHLMKAASEEEDAPFSPVYIGDPLKLAGKRNRINQKEALGSAGIFTGGMLFWGIVHKAMMDAIDTREKRDKYAGLTQKDIDRIEHGDKIYNALKLLSAVAIGYGSNVVSQVLRGSKYNYMGYKVPTIPRDVVIAFTGAESGAHRGIKNRDNDMDVADLDRRYGKGRYALFNSNDMDEAQDFLLNLPPGCRIRIQGHSYGGPAAYRLARFASDNGIPVDRLDTIDPVGYDPEISIANKPDLVKTWDNHLPSKIRPWYWPDFLALIGHQKRKVHGANNIVYTDPKYNDHTNIRLVDFAGDRKKDYEYGMSADKPLSAFNPDNAVPE